MPLLIWIARKADRLLIFINTLKTKKRLFIMQKRTYWSGQKIQKLKPHEVFVFGSNPEGRHGKGAAKTAMTFGAVYGQGYGHHGQTYAIVTKNLKEGFTDARGHTFPTSGERSVSPTMIQEQIDELYRHAIAHPELQFLITYQFDLDDHGRALKSLNGYSSLEMAELFFRPEIPPNIVFHDSYQLWLDARLQGIDQTYETFVHTLHPGSQWHPSLFTYKGRMFVSGEHFMMYSKACLFQDDAMAERLLSLADAPSEGQQLAHAFAQGKLSRTDILTNHLTAWNALQKYIKGCGRHVQHFAPEIWDAKNTSIIGVGNREKFGQNPDLLEWLLMTGSKTLVEAAWYDKIYGIGIGTEDPRRWYPEHWQGRNLLGQALMQVRDYYQPAPTSPHP